MFTKQGTLQFLGLPGAPLLGAGGLAAPRVVGLRLSVPLMQRRGVLNRASTDAPPRAYARALPKQH